MDQRRRDLFFKLSAEDRYAAAGRTALAGVAPQVIAAWMGHTNAAFTFENYAHARPEDLVAARDALAR